MLRDQQLMFSDNYAVCTAGSECSKNAAGDTVYDGTAVRNIGSGTPLAFVVHVLADFDNVTSVNFALQSHDDNAFGGQTAVVATGAIVLASLKAGKRWIVPLPPDVGNEQFYRAYYTLVGSNNVSGKVDVFLAPLSTLPKAAGIGY
jgi:hypothetical protein